MKKLSLNTYLIILLLFWGGSLPVMAQTATDSIAPLTFFNFFYQQSDSIPRMKIQADWRKLVRTKRAEEYFPGKLSFESAEGKMVELDMRLRSRGNVRKEVCFYPPIKLKIKKSNLKANGFDKVNDLKMVIQCRNGSLGEEYLLKEYLIYKLYEFISPYHYLTKLIRLDMDDIKKENEPLLAFFIEDEEEISARLGCRVVEEGRIILPVLDRQSYVRMCFFQYMILNTDWDVVSKHNLEFIKVPENNKIITIPYDFDYSGFVGTSYAVPYESLPIKSVQEPYFMGKDLTEEEILETASFFLSQRAQMEQACKSVDLLNEKQKKRILDRLEDFFELLENEKQVVRAFH